MEIFFHISWRRNSGEGGGCTDTTVANGNLIGSGSLSCQYGCSGTVSSLAYKCTDYSISENWSFGENRINYAFPSEPFLTIGFSSCCWISPFSSSWNLSSTFSMIPRNDTGEINSTPRAITSPVIRVQEGCNHTIIVPVTDPDKDIIRCRWAKNSECGQICDAIPGAVLDSQSCTIKYEANKGTGYKAVTLMIEDFTSNSLSPLSSVALQFLVFVSSSNQPCSTTPVFLPPTIREDSCIAVPPGEMFFTQIIADSLSHDVSISEIETVSPSGMLKGDVGQVGESNVYYVNIFWTPDSMQQNQTHFFCFTAVNSHGLTSDQACIKLFPGIFPPKPISALPNEQLVHPSNTTWSIKFDRDIQQPSVLAFITFFRTDTDQEVHKIDASSSSEVIFEQPNLLLITPAFTFAEKQEFHIKFDQGVVESFEGCQPGNEPIQENDFWTFTTQDVTPPEINFILQPSKSNANISFSWMSNEAVVWRCEIIHDLIEINVNCSEGLWNGYNLTEGQYILQIEATDEAGNKAKINTSFNIDLTAPIISILNKPSPISNEKTAFFRFKCDELCSLFTCQFSEHQGFFPCSSGTYTTPTLSHNMNYTFSVHGIDQVGNQGKLVFYTWTTDFEPPVVFGISNISIPCTNATLPEYTGWAEAHDDITGSPHITYKDYVTACHIKREWTVKDEAGNTANFIQTLQLDYLLSLTFLPTVRLPCESANDLINVPSDTATAKNPCGRPLQISYKDLTVKYKCPGNFTRSWTVIDECTQANESYSQTLLLYDVCPPNACGRNETIPHGTCIFGECTCNKPWYGEDCEELIYEPKIENIKNIVLHEAETYIQFINVTQGTLPITKSLLKGPDYLLLDQSTGEIKWLFPQSGNHSISVQVENLIGKATVQWFVYVKPGYNASLDPVSPSVYHKAQPILLTGHVNYIEGNVVENILAGIVPVYIDVFSNNVKRTVKTFTQTDGSFSSMFYPAPTEYGMYLVAARHPQASEVMTQSEWSILGMMASPEVVYLSTSSIGGIEKTFYNVSTLTNDGPLPIYGLNSTADLGTIPNLAVQVTFDGSTATVDNIEPGDSVTFDITIQSAGALTAQFPIIMYTAKGTKLYITVYLEIKRTLPNIVVSPPSVNARIIRGTSRIFQFNITNDGTIGADGLRAVLPAAPFLSFISFGNEQQAEGDLTLESGESAILSVLVKTQSDQQLGELTGNIIINSHSETFTRIPFKFTISSNILMNLTVVVEDEYTYFSSGQPLVNGAIVRFVNYQRNIRFTLQADNGTVTFFNIPEDRYELFVDGPNHQTLKQIIVTDVDNPIITVFIVRNAVTYSWSVTPVTFEDTYTITLEADFETYVPIPVVTVTPTKIDLEALELGLIDTFQLNITNHGLIRAENVNIGFPNHPFLYFTTNAEILGDLEPISSIIVGIKVTRKTLNKRLVPAAIVYVSYVIDVVYSYVCGDLVTKSEGVQLLKSEYRLHEISLVTRPRYTAGPGSRVSSDGPSFSSTKISTSTPAFCNKCVQTIVSCVPSLIFPKVQLPPGAPCIPTIASGDQSLSVSNILGYVSCVLSVVGKASPAVTLGKCLLDGYNNCVVPYTSRKRSLKTAISPLVEGLYATNLSDSLTAEIFGSELWIGVTDSDWLTHVLRPSLDDESDGGTIVSQTESAAILNASPPNGSNTEDVMNMLQRLNNTIYGWNNGQLEPQEGDNMISYSRVNELSAEINFYNDRAKSNGFESFLEAYNSAANEINEIEDIESESGVCAVVRIRIEQQLAVTREAFLAKLDIENKEDSSLESVTLEILITNAISGEKDTELFSIGNATLSGSLTGSSNIWSLPSGGSGTAEWLIIPYSEAAPVSDQVYDIGGTLMYMLNEEEIVIPLLPTKVIVTPDPSLHVHYFWEKTVTGDNPFTEKKELSVPFSLAVAVSNLGYGTAFNLKITSAQPEIIENEKGLLVDFKIIGTTIDSRSFTPSLTADFGDLPKNTTMVARWWMLSSLQGKFMNYTATFENINPLGDPKLTILDVLEIHELIRNVHIYTNSEDDGILDFLVNNKKDLNSYPDVLYSSKNLDSYSVSTGYVLSVNEVQNKGSVSLTVVTVSNSTGWVYFEYEDSGGILDGPVAALNTTRVNSNNVTVYLPSENSWISITQQTSEISNQKLYLHILDYVEEIGEVIFTVNSCTSSECPIDGRTYEQTSPADMDDAMPSGSGTNECAKNPCLNNGTCNNGVGTFTCDCPDGYSGDLCEIDIDLCDPLPCLNNGTCIQSGKYGHFNCTCPPLFTDSICSTEINLCISQHCLNNGTCVSKVREGFPSFTCNCISPYEGETCEFNNQCLLNPCLNNGTCTANITEETYSCQCANDYYGTNCTSMNYCHSNPCLNNGTCSNNADNSYTCSCSEQYTGGNCEILITPCTYVSCMNGGSCETTAEGDDYYCDCPLGFTGKNCSEGMICMI